MATTEDYLNGGALDVRKNFDFDPNGGIYDTLASIADSFRTRVQHGGSFEKLSVNDCIRAYSTQYVSARGDVLLVHTQVTEDKFIGYINSPNDSWPVGWGCPTGIDKSCYEFPKPDILSPALWESLGETVDYCWSERVNENCKVGFSLYFAVTVMICNFIKVVGIFLTLKTQKRKALITLGDALESFLDEEDTTTRGLCTYSTDQIQLLWSWTGNELKLVSELLSQKERLAFGVESTKWRSKRYYWGSSATRIRWTSCFAL